MHNKSTEKTESQNFSLIQISNELEHMKRQRDKLKEMMTSLCEGNIESSKRIGALEKKVEASEREIVSLRNGREQDTIFLEKLREEMKSGLKDGFTDMKSFFITLLPQKTI